MRLEVRRLYKKNNYTIGNLYINGEYFCDTLEDMDRGLTQDMTLSEINRIKVPGETAIPKGKYKITLDIVSNRFKDYPQYKDIKGRLPRLLNVPGFEGILIHAGNTSLDTSGCLLVGKNKEKGKILDSRDTFTSLYHRLMWADNKSEEITIEIV